MTALMTMMMCSRWRSWNARACILFPHIMCRTAVYTNRNVAVHTTTPKYERKKKKNSIVYITKSRLFLISMMSEEILFQTQSRNVCTIGRVFSIILTCSSNSIVYVVEGKKKQNIDKCNLINFYVFDSSFHSRELISGSPFFTLSGVSSLLYAESKLCLHFFLFFSIFR